MKRTSLATLFILFYACSALTKDIKRVEPPFWWIGMENSKLQIMVYGEDIGSSKVTLDYAGVKILKINRAESPNYLFIYLEISPETKAGYLNFQFDSDIYKYELKSRTESGGTAGFDDSDVLYLIMPDRFANGDPENDSWNGVSVDRNNPHGRHGGDFKGVKNHLDYLKDLGITTIWFNPVLENNTEDGSYHGYFTTDFYKTDPRFGSNDEYKNLIEACHKQDIKVIMDAIFNHVGNNHWWMKDLPFQDWVHNLKQFGLSNHSKLSWMDIHAPQSEKDVLVNGWFATVTPDLNQEDDHLATYLIQNTVWWIEYARLDGIRLDTYPYNDYDMMAKWCKQIYREYPDFSIVGEAFYTKTAGSAWWQSHSVLNKKADSNLKTVMDFELFFTMEHAFDVNTSIREGYEKGLFKLYEVIAQDFMYPDPYNILIFLDNHDVSRFNKTDDVSLNKFKQATAFLLTTRGIPQIYYGTEILMTGLKADGDGGLRADFPGGWPNDSINAFKASGRTEQQNEAWDYLQKLLHWRKNTPALSAGKLVHYKPDDKGVYVYARIKDGKTILVMLNGMDNVQTVQMQRFFEVIENYSYGIDVVTEKIINIKEPVEIPAKGVYVLGLIN